MGTTDDRLGNKKSRLDDSIPFEAPVKLAQSVRSKSVQTSQLQNHFEPQNPSIHKPPTTQRSNLSSLRPLTTQRSNLSTLRPLNTQRSSFSTQRNGLIPMNFETKPILFGFIYVSEAQFCREVLNSYLTCDMFGQDISYSKIVAFDSNPIYNFHQVCFSN